MRAANYNQTGTVVADLHKSIRPPRDRAVRTTIVACPDCKMPENVACISLVTGLTSTPHRTRRRMALRKEQGW